MKTQFTQHKNVNCFLNLTPPSKPYAEGVKFLARNKKILNNKLK